MNKGLKPGRRRVKFGEVVRLSKARCADPLAEGIERYVGLEHLEPGDLRIRRWGNVADGVTFTSVFQPGQVLFGKRRAYQRKVAVADFSGVCSGDIYVLESLDASVLLPELLPFICQTDAFFEHAVGTSAGSLSPRTNWTSLAGFEFALPPMEEQRRLVAILQGYMDTLGALQNLEASARVLRKSLLFDRAEAIRKYNTVNLESVVADGRPITYGIVKPGLPYKGGIPVIKVRDFPDGVVIEGDLLLTSPEIEKDYRRSRLLPGDLLFSIRGTVGRMAFVPDTLEGAQITQDTARLTISSNFDPRYVRYMLESPNAVSQVKANTMGLAVQGINLADLRKVTIPSCDLDQQVELANELDGISQGICSVITRKIDTLLQFAAARQDMLKGAVDV
ncbi:MAG: restriction endonuclease subunit S [Gallionellaceae bacterium]|nr:restriction endonuclease subunit S [Gallionellaceae bacterium]